MTIKFIQVTRINQNIKEVQLKKEKINQESLEKKLMSKKKINKKGFHKIFRKRNYEYGNEIKSRYP